MPRSIPVSLLVFMFLVLPARANYQEKKPDAKHGIANPNPNEITEPLSQTRPPRQENQRSSTDKNATQTKTEERPPFWKDPVASNWALAIIGLVAAIIAICTLRTISRQTTATERAATAADETLKAAKDTAERQLRAYVFPMDGKIHFARNYPGQNSIQIIIRNTGQTVAFDCTSCLGAGVFAFPKPEDLPVVTADMGKSHFFLAPSAKTELGGALRHLAPDEVSAIEAGTKGVYAIGAITYTDAFKIERFVKFRMVCTGDNFSVGRFMFCGEGNEAN